MPLMGSLYVGSSGLQTSQNALNTTAHNLSNVETVGYTRQQVQQSAKSYNTLSINPEGVANQQIGLGVTYSRVKQVRDIFLDTTYRKESGRCSFYQTTTETMEEVESLLGELNGEAFQTNMSDLWTSVQELAKDPSSSIVQGLLVQRAGEFVERAVNIYEGMTFYQNNLNLQIKQTVEKINEYGKRILELNEEIRCVEAGGVERANDFRDARNQILDELGSLVNISVKEGNYGEVSVRIENVDFIKGETCYEIALDQDETTGFYTPYWPQNASYVIGEDGGRIYNKTGAEVFNLKREISSDKNTDIGGLKAMLLARGDHQADYTDIEKDYSSVSESVIMNIQAEFDQLVHNIATKVNSILAEAAGVVQGDLTLADGTVLSDVSYCEDVTDGYMRKEDGSPIQMFAKVTTEAYSKVTGADGKEYWVYNEEDFAQQDFLYTLKNIRIDEELQQKPASLSFMMKDGSVDVETAEKLKDAFTEEIYTLNPEVKKTTTFLDYYNDLVSQVANSGAVYRSIFTNQEDTVEATENARQQIIGVSSDEELSNMIRFQNAFNASSRYVNAISEMLAHLINTLGV
ncbi:MAG: flagellar hook-associated protein FlgK [Lachnospiraceae bacterium]|nr:flagellar hook-associated protein FlgK [Lachnospiraceae bacterium]